MNRSMRIGNTNYIYLVLFLLFLQTTVSASPRRGMWVVRHALLDPAAPEYIINISHRLSITDLYVQVRALGKFFFVDENENMTFTESSAYRNFVILQTLAAQNQIRIHAWLNTLYIVSSSPKGEHLNGNIDEKYLLRTAKDDSRPSRAALKRSGIEGYFTDPIDPHNIKQLQKEIHFLVNSLHVEGIHLDYFRFPDRRFSYSPKGRAAFLLKYFYDPVNLFTTADYSESLESEYSSFLQGNLENLLQDIRHASGNAELTIAVKPDLQTAPIQYYQNWGYWLQQKLCDSVVLMNYNPDSTVFYSNLRKVKAAGLSSKVNIGIATYNQKNPEIVNRIFKVEQMGFAGLVLFSFNDLQKKYELQRQISLTGKSEAFRQ